MSASDSSLLSAELRLLRCTFSAPNSAPPSSSSSSLPPHLDSLLTSIERGRYLEALRSSYVASTIFPFASTWPSDDSEDSADRFYAEAVRAVEDFVGSSDDDTWMKVLDGDVGAGGDRACKVTIVTCVAVAALMAFLQRNMTGPIEDFPPFPLEVPAENEWGRGNGGKWDVWARNQLTSCGSLLFSKMSMMQYIVFAKILLSKLRNLAILGSDSCLRGNRSISWWLLRVIILQQRILDELSSSLYSIVEKLISELLLLFGELEGIRKYWSCHLSEGEASSILSLVHIEIGIIENIYGRTDSARIHFNNSESASRLHLTLTGALGFRTVHQVDPKAQMVLVAGIDSQDSGRKELEHSVCSDGCHYGDSSSKPVSKKQDCDILMTPRLLENGDGSIIGGNTLQIGEIGSDSLTAVQQAVVLAQCLYISRINPDDELSRWEVAPFIEAIDDQKCSHHMIRCFCDILRIRWESTRSRTKQRSIVMMNKLIDRIYETLPEAAQRIQFCYGVQMPTIPALRKEYGILLVSNGMISEALQIFEDLDLWDNLIYCYRLLGKKSAAVELINARLVEMPSDPGLWCALGDVTSCDTCYEKALEVSSGKSARAKRSLARSAYNRGDYEKSTIFWEFAMKLNSLYPDGWFALGAAALKSRDIDKALEGFTRAVQLDPENGEAWNNIACLHMVKKHYKQSFIAFKEALKFRRTSWQLWQNFSNVAFEIGNFIQALEGIKHVLDLSANKKMDTELLDKLLLEIEHRTLKKVPALSHEDFNDQISQSESLTKSVSDTDRMEAGMGISSETKILIESVGNALQQIVKATGGNGCIWGLYARWHRINGNLRMCSEALLKEVRSYQGSELWSHQERFKNFARASLELCNCYMEISQSMRSRRELLTADMHLRNSIKQAVNFSDTEEVRLLQNCLDNVRDCLARITAEEGN